MKFAELCDTIDRLGLRLPVSGSGRNGKILNRDLEQVIAEHYAAPHMSSPAFRMRHELNEVQLAARYDDLTKAQQEELFQDHNDWIMEEKYDGCRMTLCYTPSEGFRAFGRNRSKRTLLPVDYTSKLLLNVDGHFQTLDAYAGVFSNSFILDCEVTTEGSIELPDGRFSSSKLNTVVALLQLNEEDSRHWQRTDAPLKVLAFDCVLWQAGALRTDWAFKDRRRWLETLKVPGIELSKVYETDKRQRLDMWLNAGKEGAIFKHLNASYTPGLSDYRDKGACVKVKRTIMQQHAADIDAYIIGYTRGDEFDKQGLIAGIKLGVNLKREDGTIEEDYWIATVSGMPLSVRQAMSEVVGGEPMLRQHFYNAVLVVDGQDISGRNRRISHARVDWDRGFRSDKSAYDCCLLESFMDSQIF